MLILCVILAHRNTTDLNSQLLTLITLRRYGRAHVYTMELLHMGGVFRVGGLLLAP